MKNQFVITIDDHVSRDFALSFLKNVNFIKSIKYQDEKGHEDLNIDEVTLMSEQALSEDWLSDEDNRWDKLL